MFIFKLILETSTIETGSEIEESGSEIEERYTSKLLFVRRIFLAQPVVFRELKI